MPEQVMMPMDLKLVRAAAVIVLVIVAKVGAGTMIITKIL
jgi:hypothetical protein